VNGLLLVRVEEFLSQRCRGSRRQISSQLPLQPTDVLRLPVRARVRAPAVLAAALGRSADEVRLEQKASHLVESISEYLQRLHEPAPPHSAREGGAESLDCDKKSVADLVRLSDLHLEIMRALHAIRDARQPRLPAAEPQPAHDGALGKLSSLKRTRARVASAGRPPTDVQPMQQQLARALVNVPAHSARRQPFSAALARLATGVTCTESAAQGAQPVPVPRHLYRYWGRSACLWRSTHRRGRRRGARDSSGLAGELGARLLEWSLEWTASDHASDDQPTARSRGSDVRIGACAWRRAPPVHVDD
jgi:hypothetical protein